MKIAYFMSSILEQGGGLEKYMIESANNLSITQTTLADIVTLDDAFTYRLNRMLSFYYKTKTGEVLLKRETLESIRQKLGNARYIKVHTMQELRDTLQGYDVVYSKNEVVEAFILKYFVGYKRIPPVIFGVHTPHFYPITKTPQAKFHNLIYTGFIYNFLCKDVTAFHVSNRQSFDKLSAQFPKKKIYKIMYPFDVAAFVARKDQHKFELAVDSAKTNILWLARFSEQKGIEDLLSIIAAVNKSTESEVQWYIAGGGDSKYEDMVKNICLKYPNVVCLGHVPNNLVPDLLSKVDLFLSTSKWEVSPYNIMEAQALDKFVIAYDIAGPADIIIKGQTGELLNSINDMIETVKRYVGQRNSYTQIKSSDSLSMRFSPNFIYAKLISMFNEVCTAVPKALSKNEKTN